MGGRKVEEDLTGNKADGRLAKHLVGLDIKGLKWVG